MRISEQLIDAISGVHRWAECYRELSDIFVVQDWGGAHDRSAETDRTLLKPP